MSLEQLANGIKEDRFPTPEISQVTDEGLSNSITWEWSFSSSDDSLKDNAAQVWDPHSNCYSLLQKRLH